MARGMDISDIYAVVNYDVPFVPEEYIHRIGRVGMFLKTRKITKF